MAILVVEIFSGALSLSLTQETLYSFGRAYPTHWNEEGGGGHCLERVSWLSTSGEVLAFSDYGRRENYLAYVCRNRAPRTALHWAFLLSPLVTHHSGEAGHIRYREIEYHACRCTAIERAMHIHPTVTELIPTLLDQLQPMQ